jgi:hypothetical protein
MLVRELEKALRGAFVDFRGHVEAKVGTRYAPETFDGNDDE